MVVAAVGEAAEAEAADVAAAAMEEEEEEVGDEGSASFRGAAGGDIGSSLGLVISLGLA